MKDIEFPDKPLPNMPLDVENRLYNWKFASAYRLIKAGAIVSDEAFAEIEDLFQKYGNVGWFDGTAGEEIMERLKKLGVRP